MCHEEGRLSLVSDKNTMTKATYKRKYLAEDLLPISKVESLTFMVKDKAADKAGTGLEQ